MNIRWIWELIQNAKDVALEGLPVKMEVELTEQHIDFRHSGKPFSLDNIVFLIEQTSTKDRATDPLKEQAPQTTGKFGTGFITTHLLSKKVEVRGVMYDREENTH